MARRLKAVDIERLENTSFASAIGLAGVPHADSTGCQQCSVASCVAMSCNSGCSAASCQYCTGNTQIPSVCLYGSQPTTVTNTADTLATCAPPPPGCGNPYTCAHATCGPSTAYPGQY